MRGRWSGGIGALAPVGLEEDTVDLGEVDGLDAISDGLEERAEAEVSDASEDALGGACDEGEGVVGEDGVGESGAIELGADEGEDVVGGELSEEIEGGCNAERQCWRQNHMSWMWSGVGRASSRCLESRSATRVRRMRIDLAPRG